jgi:hypothetical protein
MWVGDEQVTEYQQETTPTEEVALFNRRDKGILYYLMQRYPEATEELQGYLTVGPRTRRRPQEQHHATANTRDGRL